MTLWEETVLNAARQYAQLKLFGTKVEDGNIVHLSITDMIDYTKYAEEILRSSALNLVRHDAIDHLIEKEK